MGTSARWQMEGSSLGWQRRIDGGYASSTARTSAFAHMLASAVTTRQGRARKNLRRVAALEGEEGEFVGVVEDVVDGVARGHCAASAEAAGRATGFQG